MSLFDKHSSEPIETILQRRAKAFEEFLEEDRCDSCKIISHCRRNVLEAEWCRKFEYFYNKKYGGEM